MSFFTKSPSWAGSSWLVFVGLFLSPPLAAQTQDPSGFREIESKYLFGFTEGSDIGLEGEKEVSAQTVGRLVKRAGTFSAFEHRLEFEFTPTQFSQFEMGVLGATHTIRNVPGLDNRERSTFGGFFGEYRQLLVGRGPSSPFGLTFSVEPVIARIDDTSGERASRFETELKLIGDTELIPNRLFMAVNALYEPEWVHPRNAASWERESTLGASTALALRVTPEVAIGSELGYFRKYDRLAFGKIEGQALFLGPTLYVQLTKKAFLSAGWSAQIAGREASDRGERATAVAEALEAGEDPAGAVPIRHKRLDLKNFERHRFKLKVAYEF